MITNNFNKELRSISDALRDLGYTDSTIGLRQRYWKEYCFFHGSLDIDEASMDEFLLKNYDIQSGNINVSKRQYEVRAALRNLLEYRRYGKIRNYHTPWFKDLPWVESFRAITEDFISHLRSQNSKPETIVNYERTLKRITNHLHSVGVDSFRDMTPEHISSFLSTSIPDLVRNLRATLSAVDDIYGTQKCAGNQPVHSSLRRKFSGYPKAIRIFVWQLNTVGGQLK